MSGEVVVSRWSVFYRSLAIWLILILSEIAHGILRRITLVPLVGEFRSSQIGVFTGSAIILLIAFYSHRWIGAKRRGELILVGFGWLLLTVTFEVLFGRFVAGLSWERIFSDYNILQGGLMPAGLIFLFCSPILASRLRLAGN